METKTCGACGHDLPLSKFHIRTYKSGRRGFQTYCKSCNKSRMRRYYHSHKKEWKRYQEQSRRRSTEVFERYMRRQRCADCGNSDRRVLTHHHLDPSDKKLTVGSSVSKVAWRKVKAEIRKCVVLCRNCHAIRHS